MTDFRRMNKNKKAKHAIAELAESFNQPLAKQTALFEIQSSLFRVVNELIRMHTPLQTVIRKSMEGLVISDDWKQDGEDAVKTLEGLRDDAAQTMEMIMGGSAMTDRGDPGWGTATKVARNGIRRSLKETPTIPHTYAEI